MQVHEAEPVLLHNKGVFQPGFIDSCAPEAVAGGSHGSHDLVGRVALERGEQLCQTDGKTGDVALNSEKVPSCLRRSGRGPRSRVEVQGNIKKMPLGFVEVEEGAATATPAATRRGACEVAFGSPLADVGHTAATGGALCDASEDVPEVGSFAARRSIPAGDDCGSGL